LVPFEIELDKKDLRYLTKRYPPIIKNNNKRLYRINKELLKNNGVSRSLMKKLKECNGDTLVVEIWDDGYE